ncbi:MAG: carboxymuconolactone decarboxylase family protein [Burkholderiales bacterium]
MQRKIAEDLGTTRGSGGPRTTGPWGVLLRSPEVCERAAALGTMLRDGTSLPTRISELAIAMAARHWSAQWEWRSHAPKGLKAGLSAQVLEAIRLRQRPTFTQSDEAATYDYVNELFENKRVSDATYQTLVAELGTNGAIELTVVTGFYSLIAMLIVGMDISLPEGVAPPLPN